MLQRLVANWLRQQAQDAVMNALNPELNAESDPTASESGEGEPVQPQRADIACFFPSAGEAGGLVDQLSDISVTTCKHFVERVGLLGEKSIAIVESNAHHQLLAPAARDVIELRKPKWVLACGFAVSLNDQIKRGSIVVADRIVDDREYSLNTGTRMAQSKGLHVGTLLTRESLPTNTEKKSLASKTTYKSPPLATETQSAVIAEVSRLQKCPMMAVFCVAQGFKERTSNMLNQLKSQDSIAGALGAAAGALLDKPGSVKEFWNDKESTLKHSDRLAKFLVSVISQLKTN